MHWIQEAEKKAVDRVLVELAKPMDNGEMDDGDYFDPWSLFPCFYGTYSADFDLCAVGVLEGLVDRDKAVWDLPSHMFREVLCNADLCDYGSSPRACFPTQGFGDILPEFIEKWKAYYGIHWGEAFPSPSKRMERIDEILA